MHLPIIRHPTVLDELPSQFSSSIYKNLLEAGLHPRRLVAQVVPARVYWTAKTAMLKPAHKPEVQIRDLQSVADLQQVLRLEKEVWEFEDADVTPLALAVATQNAGSMWIGAFEQDELVGFAFAFPSLSPPAAGAFAAPSGRLGFHSHTLAVRAPHRDSGLGYQLKLAQRHRALGMGITEMSWTFDPLRSRNAHLNFSKLGVISNSYRTDFYGAHTSSSLHQNGTDRLWVTWHMAETRVEERLRGKNVRAEMLDTLAHLPPLVRFNGDGIPADGDLSQALARQRIAIEIPGDIEPMERDRIDLARRWRMATRRAFTEALAAGFVVTEFCRSIRGQQGPGAYLLEMPG